MKINEFFIVVKQNLKAEKMAGKKTGTATEKKFP